MAKSLSEQALGYVGKDWSVSSLTREKNLNNIERLADRIEEKYGLEDLQHIKPGHLQGVIEDLKAEGLSNSTLAGYMTAAREVAAAVGKQNIVPRSNAEWGISRAGERLQPLDPDRQGLDQVRAALYQRGEHLGLAHDMREAFGLRAKESLLSRETVERNGREYLQVEGAKGGRPREIEVRTDQQRATLVRVREHIERTGSRSLCPPDKTLKQAYDQQRNALRAVGANRDDATNAQSLRHEYAQDRRAAGASRAEVAAELGHGREDVVSHYTRD